MNGHTLELLGVLLMLVSAIARSRARPRDLNRLR